MSESIEHIVEVADRDSIQLVRFLYCDVSSMIRGKAAYVERLPERAAMGIGLVKGMFAMNMLDVFQSATGLSATGEVRLVPDLDSFVVLPYAPQSAMMLCDLVELDRSAWELCPRDVLKRQIAAAAADGVKFEAAFEPEFTVGWVSESGYLPIDQSLCFSTDGMNRAAPFISSFIDALGAQGVEVEQYYPELGHGQHELSIRHAPALKAADRQIVYRETLRGMSLQHGLTTSLAPKPFLDQAGNGCHLHLSALDQVSGANLFYSESGLSDVGRQFVAGLLAHLPALTALTCASVNSYRRLQPKSWSSAYTCWGMENREAAVRVPSVYWGRERETTNLELKCVDSTGNPYLALAAVIAAGMDGVKRKLTPPEPVDVDPSTLSDAAMKKNQIRRLPTSLEEALGEFEGDELLVKTIGEALSRVYTTVKRSEVALFAAQDAAFELNHHRTKF